MLLKKKYSNLSGGYQIIYDASAQDGFYYILYDIPCYGGEPKFYNFYLSLQDAEAAAVKELT